jgi:hypothetical protein
MSDAFSAIMIVVALVLPDIRSGMIEASTTRKPSMPRTLSRWSTTASASLPMRQVEVRVIDRRAGAAAEIEHVLIALDLRARIDFFRTIGLQRRCREDLAQDADDVDEGAAVGLGRKIIDADFRRHRRVRASDAERAAAFGTKLADEGSEARERVQVLAHLVGRERDEVDLDVRRRQSRIGLEECARGAGGDRQRPAPQGGIMRTGPDAAQRMIDDVVERHTLQAARDQPHLYSLPDYELLDAVVTAFGVIAEIIADAHARIGLAPPRTVNVETGEKYSSGRAGKLPCMVGHGDARTLNLSLSDGQAFDLSHDELKVDLEKGGRD